MKWIQDVQIHVTYGLFVFPIIGTKLLEQGYIAKGWMQTVEEIIGLRKTTPAIGFKSGQ